MPLRTGEDFTSLSLQTTDISLDFSLCFTVSEKMENAHHGTGKLTNSTQEMPMNLHRSGKNVRGEGMASLCGQGLL